MLHRGTGVWVNEDAPKRLAQMAIEELRTLRDALVKADLGPTPRVHGWVQMFATGQVKGKLDLDFKPKFMNSDRSKVRTATGWLSIGELNAACTGYGDWIRQGMPVKIVDMATPAPMYLMQVTAGREGTLFVHIGKCNPLFGVPNPNDIPGVMAMVDCQLHRADRIEPYLL